MAASPAPERGPAGGNDLGRLGRGDPAHTQGQGITRGDSEPQCEQSRAGELCRATGKADLGIEAPEEPGWPVHHPAAKDFGPHRLDGGQTASCESGVDYDRTRTHAHGCPECFGAGATTSTGRPSPNSCRTGANPDRPWGCLARKPATSFEFKSTATRINTAIATIERAIHETGTVIDSCECYAERKKEMITRWLSREKSLAR